MRVSVRHIATALGALIVGTVPPKTIVPEEAVMTRAAGVTVTVPAT